MKKSSKKSTPLSTRAKAIANGYRSGLEDKISKVLTEAGVLFQYESLKIKYNVPAKDHSYCPDFVLFNNVIIETKGRFVTADRQKHLLIKQQHPELDIRFLFSNAHAKVSKLSKTTYAMWADKHGFKWAHRELPMEWLL